MTEQTHLDQRLRVPYSIGTGVPNGGNAEIEGYIHSLRAQGFCVIERVIPEDQVAAARDSVLRGRELLQKDREVERRKRIELERKRNPGAEIDDSAERLENFRANPVRPPLPPHAETCDVARCEIFAEYLAEPRVLKVARAALDTHIRIMQTEVNKSSRPAEQPISEEHEAALVAIQARLQEALAEVSATLESNAHFKAPSRVKQSSWYSPQHCRCECPSCNACLPRGF